MKLIFDSIQYIEREGLVQVSSGGTLCTGAHPPCPSYPLCVLIEGSGSSGISRGGS